MNVLNLKDVKVCLFGIQGSGKTIFAEHFLMNKYKSPVIYLMHEEDFLSRGNHVEIIIPQDKDGNVDASMKTLNQHAKRIKQEAKAGKIDAFFIDEADLFIPKDFRILQRFPYFYDLLINHRHYGLAMIFITRRPQEISTVITEQSAHYFIFHVAGKNVKDHLNKIYDNLGFLAQNRLSKSKHNFIHLEFGVDRPLNLYNAIQLPVTALNSK